VKPTPIVRLSKTGWTLQLFAFVLLVFSPDSAALSTDILKIVLDLKDKPE
jgi:hypothetical protein